jgi:hypothetical protein
VGRVLGAFSAKESIPGPNMPNSNLLRHLDRDPSLVLEDSHLAGTIACSERVSRGQYVKDCIGRGPISPVYRGEIGLLKVSAAS